MNAVETLLPVKDESFIETATLLFSQSTDTLRRLLESLESKATLFSTAHVATIIQGKIELSEGIRATLLFILHQIDVYPGRVNELTKELVDIGCEKEKVDAFVTIASRISKQGLRAATTLFQIGGYLIRTAHLHGLGFHINFTNLGRMGKPSIMFPLVRISLVVRGQEETKETNFEMDSNTLQTFITQLQELLKAVLVESASLKKALGDNFSALISD